MTMESVREFIPREPVEPFVIRLSNGELHERIPCSGREVPPRPAKESQFNQYPGTGSPSLRVLRHW
jgi:hypothetical protein